MAGQVTAIEVQKRNPRRANVFIDGEFAFGLAMIEAARLSKGQHLSDEEIGALRLADEVERAHESALNLLSYRPRSEQEVTRRLRKTGYAEQAIEVSVERLSRAGLVDDEAFARYWISNREQFKPRGAYALRHELRQRGVDDRTIDTCLAEIDEQESAYRAALQRVSRWAHLGPDVARRKMSGYLRRRGFSYETVRQVWERLLAEQLIDESEIE